MTSTQAPSAQSTEDVTSDLSLNITEASPTDLSLHTTEASPTVDYTREVLPTIQDVDTLTETYILKTSAITEAYTVETSATYTLSRYTKTVVIKEEQTAKTTVKVDTPKTVIESSTIPYEPMFYGVTAAFLFSLSWILAQYLRRKMRQ